MVTRPQVEVDQRNLSEPRPGALRPLRENQLHRPSVNMTSAERIVRVLVGLAAVIVGAVLLAAANSIVTGVLEGLLIAAGLDLFITGALGHCPLYQKLGYVPNSIKEQI